MAPGLGLRSVGGAGATGPGFAGSWVCCGVGPGTCRRIASFWGAWGAARPVTFMAPLLARLTGAGPDAIGLVFAVYGVGGVIGTAIGTRIVDSWGAWKTSLMFTLVLLAGVAGWALSAGIYPLMAVSVAIWGLGFASTNSMQQVRLVGAAPSLASASVSLNTSVLYVGQAVGSAIGGLLYARDLLYASGYVATAFVALALVTVILTRPKKSL